MNQTSLQDLPTGRFWTTLSLYRGILRLFIDTSNGRSWYLISIFDHAQQTPHSRYLGKTKRSLHSGGSSSGMIHLYLILYLSLRPGKSVLPKHMSREVTGPTCLGKSHHQGEKKHSACSACSASDVLSSTARTQKKACGWCWQN